MREQFARWLGSCFYACGRNGLPAAIDCDGRSYVLVKVLKHDFMAGTGLYEIDGAAPAGPRRIICKINRRMHFCFVPLRWLGRIVTRREVRNLKRVRRRCLRYLHTKGILSDTHGARAHTETNPVRWTGK
jgi:hypothetical protein